MKAKANTISSATVFRAAAIALLAWIGIAPAAHSQGTLTFEQTPSGSFFQNYSEQGFSFRVAPSDTPVGGMAGHNILAFNQPSSGYYVSFSLTDGGTFGLSSVDLHGTYFNGTSVQFNGYFRDGSMVAKTFTVPYDFRWSMYQFGSEFSSGLVRVDIPNNPWAMDNLEYMNVVPEPGALSWFGLGVFALVARRRARRPE